jgi:hypothetical protein
MNHISPRWERQRVPAVEPELLGSALFLVSEYVSERAAEEEALRDEDVEQEQEEEPVRVDTRAVLDLLAEELGTDPKTTLAVYIRLTALFRLLAAAPHLAAVATEPESGGVLTPAALEAAASLALYRIPESEAPADFDPNAFEEALEAT